MSLFDLVSAANNQANDSGAVKVLRQKGETKNKNEKKITETGIETKTSDHSSDFHTVLLSLSFKDNCRLSVDLPLAA